MTLGSNFETWAKSDTINKLGYSNSPWRWPILFKFCIPIPSSFTCRLNFSISTNISILVAFASRAYIYIYISNRREYNKLINSAVSQYTVLNQLFDTLRYWSDNKGPIQSVKFPTFAKRRVETYDLNWRMTLVSNSWILLSDGMLRWVVCCNERNREKAIFSCLDWFK